MNLEQYRALKAEEAKQQQSPQEDKLEQVKVVVEGEETQEEIKSKEVEVETKIEDETTIEEDKVEIEGVGEVSLDELKQGYLRQSDYTKKTQELAKQRKEAEEAIEVYKELQSNPLVTKELQKATNANLPSHLTSKTDAKIVELENKLYDLMLEKQISDLEGRYEDFEVMEVLKMAQEKNITNLEDAYHLSKAGKPQKESIDVEKLKEDLKKELLKEIDANKNTDSIISAKGATPPAEVNIRKLSKTESKIAKNMGMTNEEYVKWRDVSK